MVEVIKEGKLKKYEIDCNECNSILRYTHMDEKEIKYIDSKSTVITCPVCGKDVITGSFDSLHYCYYGKLVEEENKEDIKENIKEAESILEILWSEEL